MQSINNDKRKKVSHKLEKLISHGYELQNDFLMRKGFLRLGQNFKVLQITNGDELKALEILLNKKQKKINKIQNLIKEQTNFDLNTDENILGKNKGEIFKNKFRKNSKDKSDSIKLTDKLSEHTCKIFLDGNNMLFVREHIRKLCLKGNRKDAEEMLVKLSCEFIKQTSVKHLIVIFDQTDHIFTTNQISDDFLNLNLSKSFYTSEDYKNLNFILEVVSARPLYNTSDDYLVDISQSQDQDTSMYVTSDKGLQERLFSKGVKYIMSSGTWFRILKS
jgi:hypothetical protein